MGRSKKKGGRREKGIVSEKSRERSGEKRGG
jgi:hypothetical protein